VNVLVHLHFVTRMVVVVGTMLTGMGMCVALPSTVMAAGVLMFVEVFMHVYVLVAVC